MKKTVADDNGKESDLLRCGGWPSNVQNTQTFVFEKDEGKVEINLVKRFIA